MLRSPVAHFAESHMMSAPFWLAQKSEEHVEAYGFLYWQGASDHACMVARPLTNCPCASFGHAHYTHYKACCRPCMTKRSTRQSSMCLLPLCCLTCGR